MNTFKLYFLIGGFVGITLTGFLVFVVLGNIIARMYGTDNGIVTGLGVLVVSFIASLTCFFRALEEVTK